MRALDELAAAVGEDGARLGFLEDADETEVARLVRAFEQARTERERELRDAVDRALGFVPRPLRRRVAALVGGRGRG